MVFLLKRKALWPDSAPHWPVRRGAHRNFFAVFEGAAILARRRKAPGMERADPGVCRELGGLAR
jgi:hypothetical protein